MKLFNLLRNITLIITFILIINFKTIQTTKLKESRKSYTKCIKFNAGDKLDDNDIYNIDSVDYIDLSKYYYDYKPNEENKDYVYNKFSLFFDDIYLFVQKNNINLNYIKVTKEDSDIAPESKLSGYIENAIGLVKHYNKNEMYIPFTAKVEFSITEYLKPNKMDYYLSINNFKRFKSIKANTIKELINTQNNNKTNQPNAVTLKKLVPNFKKLIFFKKDKKTNETLEHVENKIKEHLKNVLDKC